jgi:hypothetical protein
MWWANISLLDAKEIHLTKSRDSKNPGGYEGALGFRVIDSNAGEDYYAAYLTADGFPGLDYDHAALMFYAYEKQAGMQLGVGPGSQSVDNDIKSPHIAALRVQRVNGPDEEAMVWISTKKGVDPNRPQYAPFRLAVIQTKNGKLQPFEIWIGGALVSRYNEDGSKSEFWKGFPISRHEPQNGSLIYETAVKYPVFNSISAMRSSPVLRNAEAGTECNFKDADGLIKKIIKQENGRWTRVSDNSYLW